MFSNANVKIFGGNFRTIYGNYHHTEHHNSINNYNSNNITGNTLTETHMDNSRTIYHAGTGRGRNSRASGSLRARAPDIPVRALPEGSNSLTSPPEYQGLSSMQQTESTRGMPQWNTETVLNNLDLQTKISGSSATFNPGDIHAISDAAASHFATASRIMDEEELSPENGNDAQHGLTGSKLNPIMVDDLIDETDEHVTMQESPTTMSAERAFSPPGMMHNLSQNDRVPMGTYAHTSPPGPSTTSIHPPTYPYQTPPHRFQSQRQDTSSAYASMAYALRSNVTSAINGGAQPQGDAQWSDAAAPPGAGYADPSFSAQHANNTAPPTATSPVNGSTQGHMSFTGPYTEVTYHNHTVNHPGAGVVANNVVQTSYQGYAEQETWKDEEKACEDAPMTGSSSNTKKRQSKKTSRRL